MRSFLYDEKISVRMRLIYRILWMLKVVCVCAYKRFGRILCYKVISKFCTGEKKILYIQQSTSIVFEELNKELNFFYVRMLVISRLK